MIKNSGHDLVQLQGQFFGLLRDKGRSPNTLKNYKTDLDCFNQYLFSKQKNLKMDHISLPLIKQYGEFLQTKYSSDNSRRRRVQALRMFFDYLVEK
ncbi:MAG: site-specific integrase, partial [Halobacteriovoraceae bacterium]|nr:site-specific integrase [Halobacteriovoraceae bacterium]